MRLSLALLTILATAVHSTESRACCLSQWLYGRAPAPYAVGYAPVGYAPVGYTVGYAPVASSPYAAGYSTAAGTTSVVTAGTAWNTTPLITNGAYQGQRPAYYDNPSVYTGLPVTGNVQTSYSVPITSTLRGTAPTNTYGTYPSSYQAAYGSAYPNTGVPVTAIPATQMAPVYAAPPPPHTCGLARFFGCKTNYQTTYYRAPVTYYRPVTSVDPVSGTTVTVQQPCTSYAQQVQRTPYGSLQVGGPPAQVQTAGGCQTTSGGCQTVPMDGYSVSPYPPATAAPASGIGQVGATGTAGQFTVPIPSTVPSTTPATGGYYGPPVYAPSAAPLVGAPPVSGAAPTTAPTTAPPPAGDQTPVDQPRLQNYPPSDGNSSGSEPPASYWKLQGPDDSMAMISPAAPRPAPPERDPVSLSAGEFTAAQPIAAPDEYVSPFRQPIAPPTAPEIRQPFDAPPLPARPYDPSNVTSVSNRSTVPAREAALVRGSVSRAPVAPKRDSTWYTIQP